MAKAVTKIEIRIFLASSAELHQDREKFGDFVQHLDRHYSNRGLSLQLDKWEYFDQFRVFDGERTQSQYNKSIRACDVFVCLLYTKAGEFTMEEFDIALSECRKRRLPLFIAMKNLEEGVTEKESLMQFKQRLSEELQYFWPSYDTNDKLHFDFLLWLDSYLFGGRSPLKVKNGRVMLDDVIVADMSGLSFAVNNKDFQELCKTVQGYPAKIEKLRNRTERYPDDKEFKDELQQAIDDYNASSRNLDRYQQMMIDMAKFIADRWLEQTNEKFQRAIDAFVAGDMAGANAILREMDIEAEEQMSQFEKNKTLVHQQIDAYRFQAKTEMLALDTPIDDRIAKVSKIYFKADDWAYRSNYDKEKYSILLLEYAGFLYMIARYDEAITVYQRQITLVEELYGVEDPITAISYNNIGSVCKSQGYYQKALEYFFHAMRIRESVLGKEHCDTAISYTNIGTVYDEQGEYDKALEYYLEAIRIYVKLFGNEHRLVAVSCSNIGLVYCRKGEYKNALECCVYALGICNRILGDEDPLTAACYNNIGLVLAKTGHFNQAKKYYSEALRIHERVLGTEHPSTAYSLNNIGEIYYYLKDYANALDYLKKAMDIREKKLGYNHPDTIQSRKNIEAVEKAMQGAD